MRLNGLLTFHAFSVGTSESNAVSSQLYVSFVLLTPSNSPSYLFSSNDVLKQQSREPRKSASSDGMLTPIVYNDSLPSCPSSSTRPGFLNGPSESPSHSLLSDFAVNKLATVLRERAPLFTRPMQSLSASCGLLRIIPRLRLTRIP